MLDFVVKYWAEFTFGLIGAGLTALIKRYIKKTKITKEKERESGRKVFLDEVKKSISQDLNAFNQRDIKMQAEIDAQKETLNALKDGILSSQGKQFRNDCRELLRRSGPITIDEYEQIVIDHDAYNGLGGNHRGDELFEAVKKKYEIGNNIQIQKALEKQE